MSIDDTTHPENSRVPLDDKVPVLLAHVVSGTVMPDSSWIDALAYDQAVIAANHDISMTAEDAAFINRYSLPTVMDRRRFKQDFRRH